VQSTNAPTAMDIVNRSEIALIVVDSRLTTLPLDAVEACAAGRVRAGHGTPFARVPRRTAEPLTPNEDRI
jgi:hypothetical protein